MWKKVMIDSSKTIDVDAVTDDKLVVMITKKRELCLLVRTVGNTPEYEFKMLNHAGRVIGNGYSGCETEKTPAELIRRLENTGTFYVFDTLRDFGLFLTDHQGFDNS